MTIYVDLFVGFFLVIFLYYWMLFLLSKRDPRHAVPEDGNWGFVLLIPAHNEDIVIEETVRRASALKGAHVVVINDGSTDNTERLVEPLTNDHVHLLNRRYPNAKQGKGEALNHAYQFVGEYYSKWFPGLPLERIIITVVDADGYLDPQLLDYVAGMLHREAKLGGVQTPVTIQHPERSLWLRMQDLEFVGFSCFVQQARHWFSSVGLGGNGQFIRASALQKLGPRPWNEALSEDLDIGLRLLLQGERLGYCNKGFVHQQGLMKLRPLLKQRTRWVQGHYQAWKYLPALWKTPLPLHTKLDLSLYLVLVASVFIIVINMIITIGVLFGVFSAQSILMNNLFAISPYFGRVMQLIISIGPALLFAFTYNRYAASKIPVTSWPAIIVVFCLYGWIWIGASFMALGRLIRRENSWAKTERNKMEPEQQV